MAGHMAKSILGTRASGKLVSRKFAVLALSTTALAMPAAAFAQCTADATGTNINCTGTAASYTYTGTTPATVTVASGASVTAPLIVSIAGSTLNNAGTINNTTSVAGVQMGDGVAGATTPTVMNTGTISSTGSTSTSSAISVGNNATVENAGTLTSTAGTAAVTFGTGGTFTNDAAATAAITGNIVFGTNTSTTATFTNNNILYGLTGNVTATGNINATNNGIFTGNFVQTAVTGQNTVNFTNDKGGTFTGVMSIGGNANIINQGMSAGTAATSTAAAVAPAPSVMYLYSGSVIGSFYAGSTAGTSTFTNAATLYVGTVTSPAQLNVYGTFTQTSGGALNLAIIPAGSATTAAGTTYSQLNTSGATTISGGAININVVAGYYPTNSKYDVIVAQGGLNNSVTPTIQSASSTPLIFVSFSSALVGGTTLELTACHVATSCSTNDYATALQSALTGTTTPITANQFTMAKSLDSLVAPATADNTSDAATLLGGVDVLTANEAQAFLDSLSPEGYLAYGTALRDQANTFARAIDLRMQDQNSNHDEDGWWGNIDTQFQFNSRSFNADGLNRSRSNMYGFNLGYDFSGPTHVYGVAASINWDKLSLATGSLSGSNRDMALAAYGAKNLGMLRISCQLAYNYGHLGATKTLNLSATTRTANASAGEYLFKATGQIGFDLRAGGYLIEPFVGIDYNKGQINSFTESNAGVADLNVWAIKADHTDALFGASIAKDHGKFRPYVKALYRERLSGNAMNLVTASLTGDPTNTPFTVAGVGTHKGELDANAGVNWVFDDAGALFLGYQGTMRKGLQSHGINMGIRIEF